MNHTAVNTIKTPDRTPTATVMVSESEYQKKKKKKDVQGFDYEWIIGSGEP